jgi:hypothetical protein
MSQYWENIAARTDGQYTANDFENAAYRLVCEQVIYYADRNNRSVYWLIDRYEREFKHALSIFGVVLDVNRQFRYIYAQPRHEKVSSVTVAQTLFALVLRAIYDEYARIGQMTDDGEVCCDFIELDEKYRLMTQRNFPSKGEVDMLLSTMKRWGIAKKSEDVSYDTRHEDNAESLSFVVIRPAIVDLLGETALQRLAQWNVSQANDLYEDDLTNDEDTASLEERT